MDKVSCWEGKERSASQWIPLQRAHCRSQWQRGLRHELSSLARILGSWVRIPLKAWMSVCVYSVFVLPCIGSGLATGWSLVQGVLPTVCRLGNWKAAKAHKGCRAIEEEEQEEEGSLSYLQVSANGLYSDPNAVHASPNFYLRFVLIWPFHLNTITIYVKKMSQLLASHERRICRVSQLISYKVKLSMHLIN
jgi:hypothetical protein